MLRKLFSHSFLYAIGPQIPKLANILVLPITTQYLTAVDYGIYGTLLAYSGLLSGLKMLGFDLLLVNSFFKKNNWLGYWGRYLLGLYIYSMFFSILYVGVLYFFMPTQVGSNTWYVIGLMVIPPTFFNIVSVFGGRYFQLTQKPQYVASITAFVGVLTIVLNLYTIAFLKLGYLGWFISSAIGAGAGFLLYAYPLFVKVKLKPIFSTNVKFWKKSLSVALPTIPHQYSTFLLNSSDRMVMNQLNTPIGQIGIYSVAYVFGGYMEVFGNAIGMAVGPIVTKLYSNKNEESEKKVKTLIYFLQMAFILTCSLVSLWAKELIHVLIRKEELTVAYSVSIIIIMGYSYRPLYWASVNKLFFYEQTNKLWRISFVAGVLNVALNIIFIPIYGIFAAGLTTLISLMYLGASPFFLKEYRVLGNQKFYPIYWMIAISILTIMIYIFRDIDVLFKSIISLILTLVFIIYFFKVRVELGKINIQLQ
ncbi:oligosaccharide flippase family protein [Vicingaceae bacterium]|nr:oligosaccharide flippase family protein [Vicingaceae bacterium]